MTHISNPGLEKLMQPTGWICPRCGNVYAPFVSECHNCNHASKAVTSGTTEGVTSEPLRWEYEPRVNTSGSINITSGTTSITDADGRKIRVYYGAPGQSPF